MLTEGLNGIQYRTNVKPYYARFLSCINCKCGTWLVNYFLVCAYGAGPRRAVGNLGTS